MSTEDAVELPQSLLFAEPPMCENVLLGVKLMIHSSSVFKHF